MADRKMARIPALLAGIFVLTAVFMTSMVRTVPITTVSLRYDRSTLVLLAVASLLLVLLVDALVALAVVLRHGRPGNGWPAAGEPRLLLSRSLRARWRLIGVTALVCGGLTLGALALGLPLWVAVLMGIVPWLPLYLSEAAWQYRHYGLYALFAAMMVLQLGHLGEHLAQTLQLAVNHGNVKLARGVFGALDTEWVHFVWNVALWLGAGFLLYRLDPWNVWLWAAFVFSGLHTVEHIYLMHCYVLAPTAYKLGGSAGILASGGLFPTPLARPYLHLVYNIVEVSTFAAAFWACGRNHFAMPVGQRRTSSPPALAV